MSKVEQAWAAYFKAEETVDLEALRREGWKTIIEIAEALSISRAAAQKRLDTNRNMENRTVRAFHGGKTRDIKVYRPKKGIG
jgi:predicted ArsR family transcriptional regulator